MHIIILFYKLSINRGLVLVQKVDEPSKFSDKPVYMEIDNGYVTFFDAWVTEDQAP